MNLIPKVSRGQPEPSGTMSYFVYSSLQMEQGMVVLPTVAGPALVCISSSWAAETSPTSLPHNRYKSRFSLPSVYGIDFWNLIAGLDMYLCLTPSCGFSQVF